MIPDLKVLAEKKRDLHLAEIGAWLHDMGKCSDEMIEWQAIDKPNVTKLNKKNYKKYFFNEYMDKIIVLCVNLYL